MSSERVVISRAEIPDAREHGHYLRGCCPVHGGDNPTALEVELEGEYAGFGRCFTRGCQVLVRELNPEAAKRIERFAPARPRPLTPERMLHSYHPPQKRTPRQGQPWQREELAMLQRWQPRMRECLTDDRARAYLAARAIPLELAQQMGAGYIPANAHLTGYMARWRDRIVFPIASPDGDGRYGRTLYRWEPGIDESTHAALVKKLLKEEPDDTPTIHRKTNPAGWFNYATLASAEYAVLVEGVFDALALIAAGLLDDIPVVALVGLAAQPDWFDVKHCPDLRGVILALDWDTSETQERATDVMHQLRAAGIRAVPCKPPQDGNGKDWNERWRRMSHAGVWQVTEALDALAC